MNTDEFYKKCKYLYYKAQSEYDYKDCIPMREHFMWIIGSKIIREIEMDTTHIMTFYRHEPNAIISIFGIPIKIIDHHNPEEIKLYKEIKE